MSQVYNHQKVPYHRDDDVLPLLTVPLYCLAINERGRPWHPLYVKGVGRGGQPLLAFRNVRPIDAAHAIDGGPNVGAQPVGYY